MSLSAKILGSLEFRLNDSPVTLLTGEALELLVYLAANPGVNAWRDLEQIWPSARTMDLEPFGPYLILNDQGARLVCSSDLGEFRAAGNDVRQLSKLRGVLAPGLTSDNPRFMAWLEDARFQVDRQFLTALLAHAAGLEERGREVEASKNLEYVERERDRLEPRFAARFNLDLARHHWRLRRIDTSAQLLEAAIPTLEQPFADEARVNLGAALVRLGRPREAIPPLEVVHAAESRGWALAHVANALRITDQLELAVIRADEAYQLAKADQDGYLAVTALTVKGEALLEQAIQAHTEPKDAVIAFGQALGISEVLGEEASAGVLAGLGHAHAVWGSKQKALEVSERAFKRARTAKDGPNATRALLALFATTKIASFARNALTEARACVHKPLELLALLEVAQKDNDANLAQEALILAEAIGSARAAARARAMVTDQGSEVRG